MLCQICHERSANCHIVEVFENDLIKRELCKECYEAQASPEELKQCRLLEDEARRRGVGAISWGAAGNPNFVSKDQPNLERDKDKS